MKDGFYRIYDEISHYLKNYISVLYFHNSVTDTNFLSFLNISNLLLSVAVHCLGQIVLQAKMKQYNQTVKLSAEEISQISVHITVLFLSELAFSDDNQVDIFQMSSDSSRSFKDRADS